jgi:hypothetical protein
MRWFRFYAEALNDPKVQSLSPQLFKAWVNLLCLAGVEEKDGDIGSPEEVAFSLRVGAVKLQCWLNDLVERRLIDLKDDRYTIHNWAKRQPPSDNSTPRVKALRDRDSNGDEAATETLPKRPRTEQSREEQIRAEREEGNSAQAPPLAARFYQATKTNERVAVLVEIATANKRTLDGGRAASMLSKEKPKDVLTALMTSLGANAAVLEDYMEGVLRNGRTEKAGRRPPPGRGVATTAEDLARIKAEW